MALARRRCYSIERLLRGVQISLALPFSTSLSLHCSPFLTPPLPSLSSSVSSWSSSSSASLFLAPRHPHPPSLPLAVAVASIVTRTRARARSYTHTQNRYLSFWRSRRRPSVSVLPSDGFSWPDDVLSLHAVVPGWRPSLSAPPCSSTSPRGVRQARGVEVAGLRSPLRLSLSFSSPLFSCSRSSLCPGEESPPPWSVAPAASLSSH